MDEIKRLWESIKALFDPLMDESRAVPMSSIAGSAWELIMGADPDAYPIDLYDEGGQTVAVYTSRGKLYRVPVMLDGTTVVLGQAIEVEDTFVPVRSRFMVARQADGRHRWAAIAETAVLNRVGEIDSRQLFDSFVENVQREGYPELRFYHTESLRMGQADMVARDGNVYLASGLLDVDNPLADAFVDAIEQGRGTWGTSVGFLPTLPPVPTEIAGGVTVLVYTAGVNREISVLPEERAASLLTTIVVEVTRMREDVKTALRTLMGDAASADALIAKLDETVDGTNREIAASGLITRDAPIAEAAPVVAEAPAVVPVLIVAPETETVAAANAGPEVAPTEPAIVSSNGTTAVAPAPVVETPAVDLKAEIAAAFAPIGDALKTLKAIAEKQEALDKRLAALENTDEEARERWQEDLPRRAAYQSTYRPRQAPAKSEDAPSYRDIAAATLSRQ